MLDNLLDFLKFTQKFYQVERTILLTSLDRDENDSEHSFQLALVAWYIISSQKLDYNLEEIIKYALAHDLVEIYAGDTFFYEKGKDVAKIKKEKEQVALEQIANEFPEFPDLAETIRNYEKKASKEAKFIYALDKILPIMNIYTDSGRSWRRDGVTLNMLVEKKSSKIALNKDIEKIWERLRFELERQESSLFPKT